MHSNSVIYISESALQNNIAFLRGLLGKKVMLSSVVKGNAYGHGIPEFTKLALRCGITHFSVFDGDEAKTVKAAVGDAAQIMVMGFIDAAEVDWAVQNGVSFFVFEMTRLKQALQFAKKHQTRAKVHIEVETGMNRTGFDTNALKKVAEILQTENQYLEFTGLCTHYAGAESIANYYRVKTQIERFENARAFFATQKLKPKILHTACSAASMMFPETRMDLVRIGILQFGLWPSQEVLLNYLNSRKSKRDPLARVISWKSSIMSLKQANAGSFIGYGNSYMATQKIKIAVIPIGYAHGYSRAMSNHGRVLINGKICNVIGTVNMNMVTVDVTDVENVKKGDEAVLIGHQKEASISIASFSDLSNQLNYELLTRISRAIPRKITD